MDSKLVIRFSEQPKPAVLPIFDSEEAGVIHLTNEQISEILDQDDAFLASMPDES